tara:strand:- start:44 stop:1255 length:1212 start_codon:yes stop_codon:yes gene_type:complete
MKILSAETNLGSATNVSNAPVVRLFNSGDDNILVTRKDYLGAVVGSFMVPASDVVYTEKYFTDTLEGSADVKATKVAYSSMMSFVGSSADPLPTYTHSVSATNVDEGGNFTTTISTTNVDDGTNLYWELTGVVSGDFSSGALTGTASISSNSATFSHTVDEDNLTEGTETVTIKVYSDSGRTTQVGNTLTVTIADTSIATIGNSVYFDGSDDYLIIPGSTDFHFGTGDFTIECFAYRDPGDFIVFYDHKCHPTNKFTLFAYGNQDIRVWNNQHLGSGTIPPGNQWFHVAWVRQSGTLMFFIDGVKAPTTHSWNYNIGQCGTVGVNIGVTLYGEYGKGYISNLRAVKGTAVYTSNFTPPTSALTNISGTVLLCCQSSTDPTAAAVSPGTISANGGPTAQTFGPF